MSAGASASAAAPEFWLLKIPNFLHESWEEAKKANAAAAANPLFAHAKVNQSNIQLGQPIAHIWIEKKQPKIGQRKMKLVSVPPPSSGPAAMSSGTPHANEFIFQPKPKSTMLVFGASVPPSASQLAIAAAKNAVPGAKPQPTPEAFKLDGEIALLADCLPRTNTPQYQAMLAARLAASQAKQRTTRPLEQGKETTITPLSGLMPVKRKSDGFSSARPAKVEKRVRLEAADLEKAVLALMSQPQNAFITIARLSHELRQPLNAISDMVKLLCVRQEDGVNKGLYTLKPEYKLAGDDEAAVVPMEMAAAAAATPAAAAARAAPSGLFAVKQEIKRER